MIPWNKNISCIIQFPSLVPTSTSHYCHRQRTVHSGAKLLQKLLENLKLCKKLPSAALNISQLLQKKTGTRGHHKKSEIENVSL